MCESACSEGEDFPLSFSPVKLALPPSFSLSPSLSLPIFIFCQKWGAHGPQLIGAGRVIGGKWERVFFCPRYSLAGFYSGVSSLAHPSFPSSSSFWMWAPTLNCQTLPMASPAYPPINSLSLWSFSQHAN